MTAIIIAIISLIIILIFFIIMLMLTKRQNTTLTTIDEKGKIKDEKGEIDKKIDDNHEKKTVKKGNSNTSEEIKREDVLIES